MVVCVWACLKNMFTPMFVYECNTTEVCNCRIELF